MVLPVRLNYLFQNTREGWSVTAAAGIRGQPGGRGPVIPPLIRADGTNNGGWFHSRHLWLQNEDTQRLPNGVDRLSFDDMLCEVKAVEAHENQPPTLIGAARIEITPQFPVRMSGYGSRQRESEGVAQKLWAKALAIGGDGAGGPAVMITAENCGLTPAIRQAVADKLKGEFGIPGERLVICVSHTHTAPCLSNWAPYIFGADLPDDQQSRIDKYTQWFTERLVEVAQKAIQARRPGRLAWTKGAVGFAANRRVLKDGRWTGFGVQADGPVDHEMPVLVARGIDDKLIAIVANYACHCTTLGGDFNQIAGDWAGFAQEFIEADHAGAVALITIGCGADANPNPRGTLEMSRQHGRALADAVQRLVRSELTPLDPNLECRLRHVELPFGELPTKEQWQQRAKDEGARGYHARKFLKRVESGDELPKSVTYPVATWTFGSSTAATVPGCSNGDLAMVFLGGEVVVDYARLIRAEIDPSRVWITAYANDVPCYIASKRLLLEGGYEVDQSMVYYAQPGSLAADAEDIIIDTVQKLIPSLFYPAPKQVDFPPPKSPAQSMAAISVRPGMSVDLVASEPMIEDPVAFDWGPDGRLWVAEMRDYPNGIDWNGPGDPIGKPGGRVRMLVDTDNDGRYDQSTIFLDDIPFPTGVKVWRKGILVSTAPSIFYAEDTDGDGRADRQEVLFEGFNEGNQQHRVNGLRWGLDNWLYLANGDSGGTIKSVKTGETLSISGRDLRIRPDTGEMQGQAGQTQFGRNCDDWGNWFGGNNANPMWHYVLEEHYLSRNPNFVPPDNRKHVSVQPGASPVFPTSRTLARFNDFNMSNRFTSACSPEVYRDRLLELALPAGPFSSHVFICEPVHNLVHHEVMSAPGVTFTSRRPDDEQQREFLASSDNWFRPVMARTGPDGALWIADMYRAVIEHPQWIPLSWQRKIDLCAGSDMGRIYRVFSSSTAPRRFQRLDNLETAGLVAALDSPNGWQRDMVQQLLLWRNDPAAAKGLESLVAQAKYPQARVHALYTLDGLKAARQQAVRGALKDEHPGVRRHAVRLAEELLAKGELPSDALDDLARDSDAFVRLQLAYTLGAAHGRDAAQRLAALALSDAGDLYLRAAVLSSVNKHNIDQLLTAVLREPQNAAAGALLEPLLAAASAAEERGLISRTLRQIASAKQGNYEVWQLTATAAMLDALDRRKAKLHELLDGETREALASLRQHARATVADPEGDGAARIAAIQLIARGSDHSDQDLRMLGDLLSPRNTSQLQAAAVKGLSRVERDDVVPLLLEHWGSHSPNLRNQILDVLLSRDAWTNALLKSIEAQEIPAGQVDARRRQQLTNHKNDGIRAAASKLLNSASEPSRQKVVQQYESALTMQASVDRGKVVYGKRCAACHRLNGEGYAVGPDLGALANKSPEALLVAMLDPNRAVEDRYLDYAVSTTDGRVLTGMIATETGNSISLIGQEAKTVSILRSEIDELRSTGKSLMPDGIEKDVSPQDVADVIAYLRSQSAPAKTFPGNSPETVRAGDDGAVRMLATTARIYGPTLVFEDHYRNLGWWQSADDHAIWALEIPAAGRYRCVLDYACHNDSAGDRIRVTVAGQTIGGTVDGTVDWDQYKTKEIGVVELPAGAAELIVQADGPIKSALIDLRGVRLMPMK